MNHELLIWKTEEVSVGRNPTISTAVINIAACNVDTRFFTNNLGGWVPFVATQISPNKVVIEMPKAPYDFFVGDMILSSKDKEQMAFETHRNRLKGQQDKAGWRKGLCIQFPFKLDFAIIDDTKRNGKMSFEFKGGARLSEPLCCLAHCCGPRQTRRVHCSSS